ncbi:MAG: hypothetical protein KDM63_06660 [Verrucomicrobiae bacterium]|nr:hypothetical protein [Verrucomicrobiae bacterium]
MNPIHRLLLAALLSAEALSASGCVTTPTPTNERLSEESVGSATVGKKPGAKERLHYHMMRTGR